MQSIKGIHNCGKYDFDALEVLTHDRKTRNATTSPAKNISLV